MERDAPTVVCHFTVIPPDPTNKPDLDDFLTQHPESLRPARDGQAWGPLSMWLPRM